LLTRQIWTISPLTNATVADFTTNFIYTNDLGFTKAIVPETTTRHNLFHIVDADGDSIPDFLVDDVEPMVRALTK
jgi:hypothetical protein